MKSKFNYVSIMLFITVLSCDSLAGTCDIHTCNGYDIPESAKNFIINGYSEIKVAHLQKETFLFLNSVGDINNCSVLFKIEDEKIDKEPVIGQNGDFCNVTQVGDAIISTWREQGVWNSNVYRINSLGKFELLYNDSCIDCQQVKRTYFNNGDVTRKILLSKGDGYLSRKELEGYIVIPKASLYQKPDVRQKTKAYLIKGDSFFLIDMSNDGFFYEINYKSSSGNWAQYWIKSDDFEIKK